MGAPTDADGSASDAVPAGRSRSRCVEGARTAVRGGCGGRRGRSTVDARATVGAGREARCKALALGPSDAAHGWGWRDRVSARRAARDAPPARRVSRCGSTDASGGPGAFRGTASPAAGNDARAHGRRGDVGRSSAGPRGAHPRRRQARQVEPGSARGRANGGASRGGSPRGLLGARCRAGDPRRTRPGDAPVVAGRAVL